MYVYMYDSYYDVNSDSDDFQYRNMSTDDNNDEQNYDNNRFGSSTCIKNFKREQSLKVTKNSPLLTIFNYLLILNNWIKFMVLIKLKMEVGDLTRRN